MVWFEITLLYLLFASGLLLLAGMDDLPPKELHRRSRSELTGHVAAKRIARLSEYGYVPRVIAWLAVTVSATTSIIWALRTSLTLGVLAIVVTVLLIGLSEKHKPSMWLYNRAGYLSAGLVWLLHWLDSLWAKLPKPKSRPDHTRHYEVEDLVDLLKLQSQQSDSRIPTENLKTAESALTFNDKKVSDLVVELKDVRIVLPDESVGPHLMDELYANSHSAFPVGKKVGKKLPPELSGLVYMDDLVANPLQGSVAQLMSKNLSYVESEASLSEALELFLKNHTTLLIVNNERDEATAVLWLEDVLSQLLGRKLAVLADNPADADAREKMVE